jgi:predicted amidohydrolase
MWEKGAKPAVIETPRAALAMLFDDEPYYAPELPRAAMLEGAEILLWADSEARPMDMKVSQTRAAENKMFVIRTSCAENDVSNVINPGGAAAASVFRGADQAASALIFRFEGLAKSVITGTNIVRTAARML